MIDPFFVGVLLVVESIFCFFSIKSETRHYNYFALNWLTGEHLTYFIGVWIFAIVILILIPIVSLLFKEKSTSSILLSLLNLFINVLVSIAIIITIEFTDSAWTFNSLGKLQKYSNTKIGITVCTQEVYPDFASASDYIGYGIIYIETGFDQLKPVKEYNLFPESHYDITWEKESFRMTVFDNENKKKQEISIRYKEFMD